jgi:hypothetical protein
MVSQQAFPTQRGGETVLGVAFADTTLKVRAKQSVFYCFFSIELIRLFAS